MDILVWGGFPLFGVGPFGPSECVFDILGIGF